jgi:hypothetical protein
MCLTVIAVAALRCHSIRHHHDHRHHSRIWHACHAVMAITAFVVTSDPSSS